MHIESILQPLGHATNTIDTNDIPGEPASGNNIQSFSFHGELHLFLDSIFEKVFFCYYLVWYGGVRLIWRVLTAVSYNFVIL